jgi:FAD/FMN-containing dehydrogenase
VLKNVTGLDLCKLLSGSFGTLGVITEVTLKVLPKPETSATLLIETPDLASAIAALSAGLGSPFGVSGAAALPGSGHVVAALRLEDFAASVAYRMEKLRGLLGNFGAQRVMEEGESRAFWRNVREVEPLQAMPEEAIWRISVRPSAGPRIAAAAKAISGRAMLDWGGGLVCQSRRDQRGSGGRSRGGHVVPCAGIAAPCRAGLARRSSATRQDQCAGQGSFGPQRPVQPWPSPRRMTARYSESFMPSWLGTKPRLS